MSRSTLSMTCRQALAAGAAIGATILLAGCSNGANPLDLEPGVYKGASDPLTSKPADDRAKVLADRFKLIQERE